MKELVIAAACAAFAVLSPSFAEDAPAPNEAVKIAIDYLSAYSTFDVEKIEPFLADDAVFEDPTSAGQTPLENGFFFEGKQAIIDGLGGYAAQFAKFSVRYDFERHYESAGNVVFVAQLNYLSTTTDGRVFEGAAPIVTVIRVRDGKVVRHSDYYDYRSNAVEF
ncbi:MAG: nuclear transport factor 2 family protein [Parvularculaceae bacterium]|nr:nuclear transport factor 2 family protein [Parvularculaceae bacterium]